jgi:pimeloyl-ACP methyl ester carboxylesterase
MWDAQFEDFAQHYQVVRYDMREYGKSVPVPGTFTHHDDLATLLKFLKIERAYLIGASLGGTTILNFALAYPQMAAALVTVCSTPGGFRYEGSQPPQLAQLETALQARDFERASELEVQIWVDGSRRTPDQVDARIRDLVREMNKIALENEMQEIGEQQPLRPPAIERLRDIHIPTLCLIGELDNPRAVKGSQWIAANVPNAKKIIMEGVAHLPNMERPDEFNAHVLTFLQSLTNS